MLQIANILIYISIFSVLIPIIFFLKKKQNFKTIPIKVLGILLFASAFSSLICYILFRMGKSNIPVVNIYTLIEFFMLSYMYYLLLKKRTIIYFGLILFTVFFIISTLFIQPLNEFQNWTLVVESILLIIFSASYYRQLSKTRVDLLRCYSFWINTAVYLYFIFNLYLFMLTDYILENMSAELGTIFWSFHNLNNIIKNIFFAVAIFYVGVKQYEDYDGRDMTAL